VKDATEFGTWGRQTGWRKFSEEQRRELEKNTYKSLWSLVKETKLGAFLNVFDIGSR
jgi:hypothetical protein